MINLKGKTVLVTGASRGIGAEIALAAGEAGATVLVHYARSRKAAEEVAARIGKGTAALIEADLASRDGAEKLWKAALKAAPRIDALVNNAGIFEDAPIEMGIEEWREKWSHVLQVNLIAPAELCRSAIDHFRRNGGGRIINVSSRAAFRGEAPDQWPYGASKGALTTLTKTIARGFAKDNILCFGIAPGFTLTDMVTGQMTSDAIAKVVADIPLGTMASAKECGAAAAFLLCDHARHLTGATLDINGASYVR
jgi:NAD(P)-dependent dehydrogenase (short-subunit alcohol dehydrogenase family)